MLLLSDNHELQRLPCLFIHEDCIFINKKLGPLAAHRAAQVHSWHTAAFLAAPENNTRPQTPTAMRGAPEKKHNISFCDMEPSGIRVGLVRGLAMA